MVLDEGDTDPCPQCFCNRPSFADDVRNKTVNFVFNSGLDLAIQYTFSKANLSTAVIDHDYLKCPFTEYQILNDNKVTLEEAKTIENSTRGQFLSSKWFNERKYRLTASTFGEILKCTDKRNLLKFCETLFCPPKLTTPPVIHGKTYEPIALELFQQKFSTKVAKCGLFVNEEFPNFAASPDGIIDDEIIVEVKCPFTAKDDCISESKSITFLEKNCNGSLQLKCTHNYFYQIQGQLAICKKKCCFLIVYTFKDLQVFEIQYDESFVKKHMFPVLEEFFHKTYLPFV